tara:strand:+ start:314 stop:514 length:201 start_codon:yes stop_codon:yes gene_type:complete
LGVLDNPGLAFHGIDVIGVYWVPKVVNASVNIHNEFATNIVEASGQAVSFTVNKLSSLEENVFCAS